ncbi:MAG: hypothetical protein H0U76_23335 [Ktedonobacteraceae bacterium]|nr:hypothetical protein [Ktedonobacteraceae bacterium]
MLQTRREILSVFTSSASTTGLHLVSEGPAHSHRITVKSTRHGREEFFKAVLLGRSSEWYHYRLNVFGVVQGIELVVCGTHDSCIPLPVWSVDEAKSYTPGETAIPLADLATPKIRGTKYGSLLLVAALLSGKAEALTLLNDPSFPRSTRYRYHAKVRQYATLKPGVKLNIR